MKQIILLVMCISCVSLSMRSQAKEESISIHSTIFETYRQVEVLIPERYYTDTTTAFAVTYVLDAQYGQFWNMAKANIEYMVDTRQILPTIVVGIVSENRGREFSPFPTQLLDHLEQEVIPEVERAYRVSDLRCLVGHSWAGNFIGSTLFSDRRDLFDAYVGISPSFGDTDNAIVPAADSLLQRDEHFGKFLYFSHGDIGRREAEFGGYVNSIDSLLWKYPNGTLAFERECFNGTDHWSVVIPSFLKGMLAMSRNYRIDQTHFEQFAQDTNRTIVEQAAQFYERQEMIFGKTQLMSAGDINFYGEDFRDLDQLKTARECFQWAITLDDSKLTYRINLADIYIKLGQNHKAQVALKDLRARMEVRKEDLPESWYSGVSEWIEEQLAELDN